MLVMSLLLMLLFGAINLTLIGYGQLQADGAAFVAAHAAALASPSSGPSAANVEIGVAFPHVNPSNLTVSIASGTNYTTSALVTMSAPGLPLLFGHSAPVTLKSHVVELDSNTGTTGLSFSVSQAVLKNYVSTAGVPNPTYTAHLAQQINTTCYYLYNDTTGTPTASNPCWEAYLAFDDMCAHDKTYDQLSNDFNTTSYSAAVTDYNKGTRSTAFSPLSTAGNSEGTVASWDSASPPSTAGSCASSTSISGGLQYPMTPATNVFLTPDGRN
jgi:hypothetical protein